MPNGELKKTATKSSTSHAKDNLKILINMDVNSQPQVVTASYMATDLNRISIHGEIIDLDLRVNSEGH